MTHPSTTPYPDNAPLVPLLTDGDLEALLERFLTSIIALAGAQAGAVRVLSDDGKFMRLVAQQGLPPEILQAERLVPRNCGTCGTATHNAILVWVEDVKKWANQHHSVQHHSVQHPYFGRQCQRILAISLMHGNEVLGIYNLFFSTHTPLTAETQTMLRLIGQLLGLTLHNAQLERERLRLTVLRERQEMLNEVHDGLAQTLAYVRMRLPLLNEAILGHDDVRSMKYLSDVKTGVGEAHDKLREVMTYFRSRMDPLGLLHALKGIAHTYFDRVGIALEIHNSVPHLRLNDEQEVQIYYIIQEALANIAKHSMARKAIVSIRNCESHQRNQHNQQNQLEFIIEDDGLGMNHPSVSTLVTLAKSLEPSPHFGLGIMQSRAKRLGATLWVEPNDGGGTRVRLRLGTQVGEVGEAAEVAEVAI